MKPIKKVLQTTLLLLCLATQAPLVWAQARDLRITKSKGLPSSNVKAFAEDAEGQLWIGTTKGIGLLKDEKVTTLTLEVCPKSLLSDHLGQMWVGTGKGLRLWDGKAWRSLDSVPDAPKGRVDEIYEDSQGDLWFGGTDGLSKLQAGAWRHFGKADGLGHRRVFSIAEDSLGNVHVGHFGGVVTVFSPNDKCTVKHYGSAAWQTWAAMGLLAGSIGWSAIIYPPVAINLIVLPFAPIGLHARLRTQVEFDYDGNYWVGNSGRSLLKNPDTNRVRYGKWRFKAQNIFYDLMADSQGNLWLGSSRGGSVFGKQGWSPILPGLTIFKFFEDSQGRIWTATRKGAIPQ